MDISAALYFKNSQEWYKWLEQNHNKEIAVWLVIYKKRSKQIGIRYDEALEEALCFGWIDGKMQSVDEDKFILRYSPRKSKSVWSNINKEKSELLILQGRMTDAGLAKIEEAKKNGLWQDAYTNKKKDVIPVDLETALSANRIAWVNFHGFANSYRNMYIGWVTGAKAKETRMRRIAEVVKRSTLNKKPGI
ncbi:YdeI family protein [Chloroflexota bacterium]